METLVILAAVAATLLACIFVVTLSKGPRQPPLRLPREEEWADNADEVSKVLTATEPSPIDREAQVLDARVLDAHVLDAHVMGGRMAEGPVIEGRIIEGEVVDGAAGVRGAGPSRRFEAEELDSRMLDQLLDQQNRALKQALEPDATPPSEAKDRPAR
ncbi:Transmembrane protein [Methylorubrum aminovorans]